MPEQDTRKRNPLYRRKWVFSSALALFALAFFRLVVIPLVIGSQFVQKAAERELKGITGLDVRISGIAPSGILGLTLYVGRVEVLNPPGFTPGPLLVAEEIHVSASWPALSDGVISIRSATVERIRVRIERAFDGRVNIARISDGIPRLAVANLTFPRSKGSVVIASATGMFSGPIVEQLDFSAADVRVTLASPGQQDVVFDRLSAGCRLSGADGPLRFSIVSHAGDSFPRVEASGELGGFRGGVLMIEQAALDAKVFGANLPVALLARFIGLPSVLPAGNAWFESAVRWEAGSNSVKLKDTRIVWPGLEGDINASLDTSSLEYEFKANVIVRLAPFVGLPDDEVLRFPVLLSCSGNLNGLKFKVESNSSMLFARVDGRIEGLLKTPAIGARVSADLSRDARDVLQAYYDRYLAAYLGKMTVKRALVDDFSFSLKWPSARAVGKFSLAGIAEIRTDVSYDFNAGRLVARDVRIQCPAGTLLLSGEIGFDGPMPVGRLTARVTSKLESMELCLKGLGLRLPSRCHLTGTVESRQSLSLEPTGFRLTGITLTKNAGISLFSLYAMKLGDARVMEEISYDFTRGELNIEKLEISPADEIFPVIAILGGDVSRSRVSILFQGTLLLERIWGRYGLLWGLWGIDFACNGTGRLAGQMKGRPSELGLTAHFDLTGAGLAYGNVFHKEPGQTLEGEIDVDNLLSGPTAGARVRIGRSGTAELRLVPPVLAGKGGTSLSISMRVADSSERIFTPAIGRLRFFVPCEATVMVNVPWGSGEGVAERVPRIGRGPLATGTFTLGSGIVTGLDSEPVFKSIFRGPISRGLGTMGNSEEMRLKELRGRFVLHRTNFLEFKGLRAVRGGWGNIGGQGRVDLDSGEISFALTFTPDDGALARSPKRVRNAYKRLPKGELPLTVTGTRRDPVLECSILRSVADVILPREEAPPAPATPP